MGRGPICGETNHPSLSTPGPAGVNDAGDPDCSPSPASVRGILGSGGPSDETLVGRSEAHMRREAERIIGANPNHPLQFLLDMDGKFKRQQGLKHSDLINRPDIVQMGHILSKKAGGERVMLQGAWENQFNNVTIEGRRGRGAFVLDQPAVDIGGIAVDRKTALSWEKYGFLKPGTVEAAPKVE